MKQACFFLLLLTQFSFAQTSPGDFKQLPLSILKDKIKGGWAGQTIGVTFGGPHEFRFNGTFIQDYQPLNWNDNMIKDAMLNNAGLYDDVYMDLTFVEVFQRLGLNAPTDSFASAYAHAGYMLWHANQAGRYNILNGMKAPESGHWLNNPHADDIDYQIESDFAGLMSPGMPAIAAKISDRIGHIMNYGDGWYGGVLISTMYSLAFFSSNVEQVVKESLKAVPANTSFYKCIADVIRWHQQYPTDWHQTWFELQKKWSAEIGCPDGVFAAFNIDAKINAAYVVLGLLYGKGDFEKTIEIATRAGQDADCNPSSAAGVLGTIIGYDKIPMKWKKGLQLAEDIDFKYTSMSLNKTYEVGFNHALENIKKNAGYVQDNIAFVSMESVRPVQYEQSFEGLQPVDKISAWKDNASELTINFTGAGIVVRGEAIRKGSVDSNIEIEISIDNGKPEHIIMPTNFTTRKHEIYWNYKLADGKEHVLKLRVLNASADRQLRVIDYIVYRKQSSG